MRLDELLAIVEVPRDSRVRCQAEGCNHPVFRRVHVVHVESGIHVYGSECFKRLFGGLPVAISSPTYTSGEGRLLTEAERQLLIDNTERLIQRFRAEREEELARKAATAEPEPIDIEARAKAIVREKYQVNPDLPGWRGLVQAEMKRLLDGN